MHESTLKHRRKQEEEKYDILTKLPSYHKENDIIGAHRRLEVIDKTLDKVLAKWQEQQQKESPAEQKS